MIDALREAFNLAAQPTEQEQAALATHIKGMIEAGGRWDALLADPDSLNLLEEMAEEAHLEYLRGETDVVKACTTRRNESER